MATKKVIKKPEIKEETSKIVFTDTKEVVNYEGRGFNTIDEAYAFVETEYFKKLGQADQDEFIKWLY